MNSKSKTIKVFIWSLVAIALVLLPSLQRVRAQTGPALPDFDYNFDTLVNNQTIFGQDQWVNNQLGDVLVRTGRGVNQTQTAKGDGGFPATGAIRPLDHPFYYTTKDTNVVWGVWSYVPSSGNNITALGGILPCIFGPNQLGGLTKLTTFLTRQSSPRQLTGDGLLHDHWYEYRVIVDFSIYGGSATLSYRDVTGSATVFTNDSVLHNVNLGLVPDASGRYGFFDVLIRNDGAGYVDNLHFDAPAPTGACVPPPPGLKGWWPLDETTGTTVADIIGGHNGTALPGPIGASAGPGPVTSTLWPPPTFQVGMVNNSLFFSGQRRIEVPSHSDLEPGTGDFTIDAWVIYAASGNGQLLSVAQKNTGATAPFGNTWDGWRLVLRDSSPTEGRVSFRGSLSVGGSVEEPITPNTWHHVSATLSTTSGFRIGKVYVDGVSFSQVGLNGDITSTAPMLIGGDGIDAGQIAVDELEIFNRALTETEIQGIFNAGSAGKCKCVPPPSGMVSWWPGDGNANDIQDGNNGTLTNGATFAAGKVGQAFSLDGIDDFVQVPDNTNLQPTQFTIDAWIKTATIPEPIKPALILARSGPNGFTGYDLAVNYTSGVVRLVVRLNQFTFGDVTGNTNVADGNWHHVAGTYDGNTVNVYVDGVLQGATPYTAGVGYVSGDPLLIGKRQRVANTSNFNGLIDEVEIFNRALSPSEILSIFNAGSAGKCKGCATPPANMVGWWPADGNAIDITPSPDNGTLNGGATFASGEVAQAFSLNGTTAYVSAPSVSKINFGTGDFSIDAWIKTSSATGVHAIVDKRVGNNAATFTGYHLFTFNGNLAVQLSDGTFLNFISTTNVADGAFHHVAVTVVRNSATGGNLYVDGVPVFNFNPTGRPGSLTNNAELRIGRNCPNTVLDTFFNGLIDEVELFNRALSTAEVQAIFLAGSRGKCKCTITCPANITVSNDLNQCGAVVTYTAPNASSGCGTVTCSPASGSFFPVGTTTVTCSTTAGPSCTFTVTVNDTQPPSITCPPNITAETATINDPCVVVSFSPVAIDNCPGVTKVCSPPSMSCFPVGTTTVTCTATDSSGNTATCSFTVTVFNVCLQDDSNPSIVFLGNTVTGAYRFCCGGTTFTGVAQVTKKGNIATFQQNGLDRRVTATIDGAAFKGSASLQSPPGTIRCTITDRDTRNNSCVCQ